MGPGFNEKLASNIHTHTHFSALCSEHMIVLRTICCSQKGFAGFLVEGLVAKCQWQTRLISPIPPQFLPLPVRQDSPIKPGAKYNLRITECNVSLGVPEDLNRTLKIQGISVVQGRNMHLSLLSWWITSHPWAMQSAGVTCCQPRMCPWCPSAR